jgi:hypothetical protein
MEASRVTDIIEANERYMEFMKRNLTVLLTTGALAGALFTGLTFARAQSTNPVTPPAATGTPKTGAVQRHPQIVRAISALQGAKRDMENANHDFGGHKKAAMEACDKALAQLELVLKNDKP